MSAAPRDHHPAPPINTFVSVIVPMYNEGDSASEKLADLSDTLALSFADFEVIAISDGSTDGTNASLSKFSDSSRVKIRIRSENRGKGATLREGFSCSCGDVVMFIDGGMELSPANLRIFVGLLDLYGADIVIGSKRHPQSQIIYPWYRRLLSRMFQELIRFLFKLNVTDTQVGIKAMRREVVEAVLPHLNTTGYAFDLELLAVSSRLGFRRVLEAPISLDYYRFGSRSTVADVTHVFRIGFQLARDTARVWHRVRGITMRVNEQTSGTGIIETSERQPSAAPKRAS